MMEGLELTTGALFADRHNYWHAMYKAEAMNRFDVLPAHKVTRFLPTTVEGVCARAASKSYISVLSQEQQNETMETIRQLLQSKSDEELQRKWIDEKKGIFEYPYTTGEWAGQPSEHLQYFALTHASCQT